MAAEYKAKHPEKIAEQHRRGVAKYAKANPERHRAHIALGKAVKAGKIARPTRCERCNVEANIEAHHADYSKPLSVDWLCKPCHEQQHHG